VVAVIDVGNTNIHFGLYKNERLIKRRIYATSKGVVEKRILRILKGKKIDGAAIASVVPCVNTRISRFFKRYLKISPLIISSKTKCNLKFGYHNPRTLGADRIANVVGALARYENNLIVLDFGTATTLDVVFRNGNYLGGIITPGIEMSFEIIANKTGLLPRVSMRKPRNIIGRSTKECIQSGIFNGTVAMIDGLIQRIEKDHRKKFLTVATGGWGRFMTSQIKKIKYFDQDLGLYGILKIYNYNA
jgi:type III pantothenate kinase